MKEWIITPDKYLSEEDLKKLLDTLEKEKIVAESKGLKLAIRNYYLLQTGIFTGCRVSELSKLKIKHLYLKNGESQILIENSKNKKSRMIMIDKNLKKNLKDFLDWKKIKGESVGEQDYVFVSERNKFMNRSAIEKVFKKYAKMSGLNKKYSIHSLRHTMGTRLLKVSNWNIRLVQKHLGHASLKTTEIYANVMKNDMEEAINKLVYV